MFYDLVITKLVMHGRGRTEVLKVLRGGGALDSWIVSLTQVALIECVRQEPEI